MLFFSSQIILGEYPLKIFLTMLAPGMGSAMITAKRAAPLSAWGREAEGHRILNTQQHALDPELWLLK